MHHVRIYVAMWPTPCTTGQVHLLVENKVQLCGKYNTVMQITVVVLGVKFLCVTTVTILISSLTHCLSVKMSSFDTAFLPLLDETWHHACTYVHKGPML